MSSSLRKSLAQIASSYDTDKAGNAGYIEYYERNFESLRELPLHLLELGVFRGGSLLMWEEYFPRATIVGLDEDEVTLEGKHERIRTYQGKQNDTDLLSRIAQEKAPEGFDIIIDDASHIGALVRTSFWHLFDHHLKPGGIYAIEDWGTGYWPSWPDGAEYRGLNESTRSLGSRVSARLGGVDPQFSRHNFGMVGLIKELVDECGMEDITHAKFGTAPHRASRIQDITLRLGLALIRKKGQSRPVT